ncbi:glycoside hydrolase family 97 protein [Sphingomonas oligophenolica]|uniref:Glycoside hydrolase family 97 protein n=1 Tax=Sphingomonas oligophenolica TaxID=301154 RepID=A0ABU9Y063_9SPHN
MKRATILLAASIAAGLIPGSAFAQAGPALASPDQRTRLELKTADGLGYTLTRDGQPVLAPSPIGLFTDHGALGAGALLVTASEKSSVDDSYAPLAGKASRVADRYNQLVLHLSRATDGARFDLVLRAYDDGIAFRFVVPAQKGFESLDVFWESTGFYFPRDYQCWGMNSGKYDNSHEGEFDPVRASAIRNFHLYDAPLVCKTGAGETTFAIAEADKRDYAGAYLSGRGDGGLGVNVSLTPRADNPPDAGTFKTAVRANLAGGPLVTPWRVVMLGDHPGDLIASSLIALLATPSAVADTSWIKPGKSAWDWWNGWAVDIPDAGVNTATYKAYVDFAQKMKLDYILIDEGWYKGSSEMPRPADVTVPVPAMDIPEIVHYAADRKVGVWVWLHWKQLERQLEPALALYEAWGIKGIKVDFMDRNDQEMVGFYHRLLSKAAAHHLMVDLHGAYPPDGLARTYTNFLTQEGVMGAEYNKWSTRVTATHNVTLPFTRMLLGPMDYTPGGFHALPPAAFAAQRRSVRPFVQTTRGQAIAMYVVYDSPLSMVADSPDSYVRKDGTLTEGADVLARMPTSWDETRVLMGDIGDYIVMARRKGSTWYIGAMTNETGRTLSVPLTFLRGDARFVASIHEDGADPDRLRSSERNVTARDRITLRLAGSGGAVVELTLPDQ